TVTATNWLLQGIAPSSIGGGHGLTGMSERVALVGGAFQAGATPGGAVPGIAWLPWGRPGPGPPHSADRLTGGTERPITALIVDDDTMAVNGLAALLGAAGDLHVLGRCADGDEVAAAVAALRPDVVLCDVRMPRMDGVAVVRAMHGTGPA